MNLVQLGASTSQVDYLALTLFVTANPDHILTNCT